MNISEEQHRENVKFGQTMATLSDAIEDILFANDDLADYWLGMFDEDVHYGQ